MSSDAVRTIDAETTRYPVEFGRATGGVIALFTGMGDKKFRFNATNFVPSFRNLNGYRFDKVVPRFTFSGPLIRDRAWFYDGLETEYDNIYIVELPVNANSDQLTRGSNLFKVQVNLTPANILTGGLIFNGYHSLYDGISSLTPQQSTTKRNTTAWFPYLRDKWASQAERFLMSAWALFAYVTGTSRTATRLIRSLRNYQQATALNLTGRSQREEGTGAFFAEAKMGRPAQFVGVDLRHTGYSENVSRAPISYLREDMTLLRRSDYRAITPFNLNNVEVGGYAQDRWQCRKELLIEPGLRFDWDEIVRRPLISPRVAAVFSPAGSTKISAGIGLYYEHTQLDYLTRTLEGSRYDTYFADGVTPTGPAQSTSFTANYNSLRQARAVNWSAGIQQRLPWAIFAGANFMQKRTSNVFTYVNQNGSAALSGNYLLTNQRQDRYSSFEVDARRLFAGGYSLFVSYTHSSARTNAALDYVPTISPLGPQQSGPLAWDTPNRTISVGMAKPVPIKRYCAIALILFTRSVLANRLSLYRGGCKSPGSGRGRQRSAFPEYIEFNPGLEWKFHFRGAYFGLRGVMENATGRANPVVVNNVKDSPQFGTIQPIGGQGIYSAHSAYWRKVKSSDRRQGWDSQYPGV